MFGPTASSSLFGAPQSSATPSLFGPSASSSLFGQTTTQQPQQQQQQQQPTTSLFGQSVSTGSAPSLFGQTTTQQQQPTTSLFGQTTTQQPTTSLFGAQPTTSLFGQSTAQPTTSLFGQQPATTSLFGQSTAQPTTSLFGQSTSQPTTSLFGQTTTQQPTSLFGQPLQQQPIQQQQPPLIPSNINESAKFSDLPAGVKLSLNEFNKTLIQNSTYITQLQNNQLDFGSLSIELDQIASNIESLAYNYSFHISSFKSIEDALMRPLSSVNIQFNLLSTTVLTSFQNQALPSREMEIIVDELYRKLERIKNTLTYVIPHHQKNLHTEKLPLQESFVSTLDNNQKIIQSEAIFLSSQLKVLDKLKKQLLDYKARQYQDSYNPFKYYHQIYHQQLKKQNEAILNTSIYTYNSGNINSINSNSSMFGASSMFTPSTPNQQQLQQQQQQQQTPQQLTTSNLFGGSTPTQTTITTTTTPNTLSLVQGGSLFNPSSTITTTSNPLSSIGSGSLASGGSSLGSIASSLGSVASSLGSQASSIGGSSVFNPSTTSVSNINNNNTNINNGKNNNSGSKNPLSQSQLFINLPPQTPVLGSQTSFLHNQIPGFSISGNSYDTPPLLTRTNGSAQNLLSTSSPSINNNTSSKKAR